MADATLAMPQALWLVTAIGGVLVLASLVGAGLKILVARSAPHAGIDNLNARVLAWWVISASVGLALLGGTIGVTLLFAFASCIALQEFATGVPLGHRDRILRVVAFLLILPAQYLCVGLGWYALWTLFIPLYALAVFAILAASAADRRQFVGFASSLHWGLLLCVYSISHVPALLTLDIADYPGSPAFLVLFLILVVQASDVLQYVFGKLFGRRKIAPAVSPSKTVEGFAGGVLSATALGAAFAWITPFSAIQATLIAAVLTLLGFLGGLVFSALKRARGLKDWGNLIPGHGGMLDRLDSLCFSAPVFFYIVRFGWSA